MLKATKKSGFTIIELLIVIVVIGILATITIVLYNGIQTRANNVARTAELRSWTKLFEMYKTFNGNYPRANDPSSSGACLGTGFPIGEDGKPRCRELHADTYNASEAGCMPDNGFNPRSNSELDSAALMNSFQDIGMALRSDKKPIDGWIVGPWVEFFPTGCGADTTRHLILSTVIEVDSQDSAKFICRSSGFKYVWGGGPDGPAAICSVDLMYQ